MDKPDVKKTCPTCGKMVLLFKKLNVVMHEDPACPEFLGKLGHVPTEQQYYARLDTNTGEVHKVAEPPPSAREAMYQATLNKMSAAARLWVIMHPGADLRFRQFPKNVAVTGNLDEEGIRYYGETEQAREFLRELDRASDAQATILMARGVVETVLHNGMS